MRTHEEDPFDPSPEWKDWVLTLITVKDIIDMPSGSSVGRIALMEAEVLDSRSSRVDSGEIANHTIPLIKDSTVFHLSDELRKYVCFDEKDEVTIGAAFLVATYHLDGHNSRTSVTTRWPA